MRDLRAVGCDLLTLGQYLRPSEAHLPVAEFVEPEAFAELVREARALGFTGVAGAPFVRSSYHAAELIAD
jgi:lipoic acid synthetase